MGNPGAKDAIAGSEKLDLNGIVSGLCANTPEAFGRLLGEALEANLQAGQPDQLALANAIERASEIFDFSPLLEP